jgi:hypothetical protein
MSSNSAYLAVNVRVGFPENRGRAAFAFTSVSTFKVESSWKVLTDTAEFVVSKQLCFADQKRVFDLVKSGDPVYLEAGYNGEYNREFTGFISEVQDDLPVLFKCEDNMYTLKRTPVNKSYKGVKLQTLLNDIVPSNYKIDCADVVLGDLLYQNYTVSQVLTELKDNYGIYSYFVGETLVSGKIYRDNTRQVKYTFTKNILPGNDLKYRRKEDIRIKVTMTSHLKNGKKKKKTYGESDGEEQKLICAGVEDEAQLLELAKKEYNRLKINGWKGGFRGFGLPFIQHGDTIVLTNLENPDKNGNYYCDGVTTSLDDHGALRRDLQPGPMAA